MPPGRPYGRASAPNRVPKTRSTQSVKRGGRVPPGSAGTAEAMRLKLEEMAERARQKTTADSLDPKVFRRIEGDLRDPIAEQAPRVPSVAAGQLRAFALRPRTCPLRGKQHGGIAPLASMR